MENYLEGWIAPIITWAELMVAVMTRMNLAGNELHELELELSTRRQLKSPCLCFHMLPKLGDEFMFAHCRS